MLINSLWCSGRPQIDDRSRPIGRRYELGVKLWQYLWPHLTPICQQCPPMNCQVLIYPDLWLTDKEGILPKRKKEREEMDKQSKKKKRAHTTECNNNNTNDELCVALSLPPRTDYCNIIQTQRMTQQKKEDTAIEGTSRTTTTSSNSDKLVHIMTEMAPHHDNGIRDITKNGQHIGANPDKEV